MILRLSSSYVISPVKYTVAGERTGEGHILFRSRRHTQEGLKRLLGPKVRKKMKLDIWLAVSQVSEAEEPSSTEPSPPEVLPPEIPPPEPQESAENPKVQAHPGYDVRQIFIGCLPNWLSEQDLHERLKTMFEPFGKIKWLRIGGVSSCYSHAYSSDRRYV
jgi:hypothetical protein